MPFHIFFSFKNVGLVSMKTRYLRNRRYLQNSNTINSTFVLETKLRTLAEQKVLLPTEPSLQPLYHNFKLQAKNLNMLIYLLPIPVPFISDFRLSYICHTLRNKYPVIVFFFFLTGLEDALEITLLDQSQSVGRAHPGCCWPTSLLE